MKNTDNMLQTKIEALDHLLSNPRPDDCLWPDQLLTALEQVSKVALHPRVPVKAIRHGDYNYPILDLNNP